MSKSKALTRGVRVSVEARFLPERSRPDQNKWLYTYQIEIANEGPETVQLLSRP